MATLALAFPVLPGKTDDVRAMVGAMAGSRKEEFDASERRNGFTREHLFLQTTSQGDLVIVVVEAANPGAALGAFGASQDPFDLWQKERISAACGIDMSQPPQGPPPELLLAWSAD